MANHRKAHPARSWRGCAMCKPYKWRGVHDLKASDRRRIAAAEATRGA